jgi:transposase-like protein
MTLQLSTSCLSVQTNLVCPFCHSPKVVKHGKTSANKLRLRCISCKRTWVKDGVNRQCPDFGRLTEAYLSGSSYRDLRSFYRSSPIRINQKIREYLEGCPSWEEYLDACTSKHESRLIHLVGKKFKASAGENDEHTMYLALAIDALSTVVLGFEIGECESENVWLSLLDRMNCRGIVCPTFMSYGFRIIEDAIKVVFPYSETLHNFTRTCYDKHLKDEIRRSVDTKKLIMEAISAHMMESSCKLEDYLIIFKDRRMKQIVLDSKEYFVRRLQERISQMSQTRFEGLLGAFQNRFKKFHMIKYDPYPIINAWIAWWMLEPLPIGFSRLSLYLQWPCETHFKNFNCGTLPRPLGFPINSPEMRTFVVELAVRSLQLPVK